MRQTLVAISALAWLGCGSELDELGSTTSAASGEVTIAFNADWSVQVQGPLEQGRRLNLVYATERADCRAQSRGSPAWTVTALYRWNDGEVSSTYAAGHNPDPTAGPAGIDLDRSGKLELWFQNTSVSGCNAWDSNFGRNYVFEVQPAVSARGPAWMGNVSYAIERQTCDGGVCPGAWRSLADGLTYSTWARQRAALRLAGFEVWLPGVTDLDNPNLWQQLDVQVRHRYVGESTFTEGYLDFDRRWGNNAHYAFDLRSVDPFEWPRGANLNTRADCPGFTVRADASGQYVEAQLEFYFIVNGAELRDANSQPFRATFQDYLGRYGLCF